MNGLDISSTRRSSEHDRVDHDVAEKPNIEGTYHQSQMSVSKPKRKHFFSPLDPSYADAVHRDAATVEYSAEEEVRVVLPTFGRLF